MGPYCNAPWVCDCATCRPVLSADEALHRAFYGPKPEHPLVRLHELLAQAALRGEKVLIGEEGRHRLYNPEAAALTDDALALAPVDQVAPGAVLA